MFAFSSHGSAAESETSADESSDVSSMSDDEALVLEGDGWGQHLR